MRVEWINEGKPKSTAVADGGNAQSTEQDQQGGDAATKQAERIAPIFEKAASGRPKTPDLDDLFGGEDDIYNATPIDAQRNGTTTERGGEPDDDELEALMADEEASGRPVPAKSSGGAYQSIFGGSRPRVAAPAQVEVEDDLDALIAEAGEEQASRQEPAAAVDKRGKQAPPQTGGAAADGNDEDDLDALMAEAEAHSEPRKAPGPNTSAGNGNAPEFNDEEEAMAEMDGLW